MRGSRFILAGAAVFVLLAATAYIARRPLERVAIDLFGPPRVSMVEAYAGEPALATFDHGLWDALVREHVRPGGLVDYDALAADPSRLNAYLGQLADANLHVLGRDERLALLINAYNAFTLRLILDHRDGGALESIRDIPEAERWDAERWELGGNVWSLNRIEHGEIRPNFAEPRIHFALVCAANGCPPLRREAYVGARLDTQLEKQTLETHRDERHFRFDPEDGTVHRTALYDWYRDDFEQHADSVLEFMARYSPELRRALDAGRTIEQRAIDYDWSLNSLGSLDRSRP